MSILDTTYSFDVSYYVVAKVDGKWKYNYKQDYIQNIKLLHFDTNEKYYIGLDQSTSACGLTFRNKDATIIHVLDIINRSGSMNRDAMFSSIGKLINRSIEGREVPLFASERPLPKTATSYTSSLLTQIYGKVSAWCRDYDSLVHTEYKALYPGIWRKAMKFKTVKLKDPEMKFKIATEICEQFPQLKKYLEIYTDKFGYGKDFDGFESFGIIEGCLRYAYDEYGNEKIHGDKEQFHTSHIFYKYEDISNIDYYDDIVPEITENEVFQKVGLPKFLVYNDDYKFFDNVRMASSNNPICFTILPDSHFAALQFEYGWVKDPKKEIVAIIAAKRDFVSNQYLTMLERIYPCHTVMEHDLPGKKNG